MVNVIAGKQLGLIRIKERIMFGENLKTLRKQKGYSQEELATRLHVVRQTISKWEKNLSVPDADTLIRIAEIFEVSVSELLGVHIEEDKSIGEVAQQLSRINEQLAIKNRRAHRIWKTIGIVLASILAIYLVIIIVSFVSFKYYSATEGEVGVEKIEVIEEE